MKIIWLVLMLLLTMIGLLLFIGNLPEPAFSSGLAHAEIAHMRSGGDGAQRFALVGLPAFFLQVAVLLLMLTLLVMGISKQRRSTALFVWVGVIAGLILTNWWMVYSSYKAFLLSGEVSYFLGFPTPSAWMIFGTWVSGSGLVFLYVFGFDKFIFSKEDEAEYLALLGEFGSQTIAETSSEKN